MTTITSPHVAHLLGLVEGARAQHVQSIMAGVRLLTLLRAGQFDSEVAVHLIDTLGSAEQAHAYLADLQFHLHSALCKLSLAVTASSHDPRIPHPPRTAP